MDILKTRIGWFSAGMTFIISGFVAFSNHPERGPWFSAVGVVIILLALFVKPNKERRKKTANE